MSHVGIEREKNLGELGMIFRTSPHYFFLHCDVSSDPWRNLISFRESVCNTFLPKKERQKGRASTSSLTLKGQYLTRRQRPRAKGCQAPGCRASCQKKNRARGATMISRWSAMRCFSNCDTITFWLTDKYSAPQDSWKRGILRAYLFVPRGIKRKHESNGWLGRKEDSRAERNIIARRIVHARIFLICPPTLIANVIFPESRLRIKFIPVWRSR